MLELIFLVPVVSSDEEADDVAIEFRDGILYSLCRVQRRGQFHPGKGVANTRDGLC